MFSAIMAWHTDKYSTTLGASRTHLFHALLHHEKIVWSELFHVRSERGPQVRKLLRSLQIFSVHSVSGPLPVFVYAAAIDEDCRHGSQGSTALVGRRTKRDEPPRVLTTIAQCEVGAGAMRTVFDSRRTAWQHRALQIGAETRAH